MEKFKFCSNCGFKMLQGDRFCSNCGRDTLGGNQEQKTQAPGQNQQRLEPNPNQQRPQSKQGQNTNPNMYNQGPGSPKNSNTGLIVAICAILAMLLLGGIIFAIFSMRAPEKDLTLRSNPKQDESTNKEKREEDPSRTDQEEPGKKDEDSNQSSLDLSKAKTYLSKPGLKATFFVNYPDGTSGVVDRISSSAAPDTSVIITEVELGVDMGEEYGFGSHYVEREDGTYIIYDSTPYEIMPVMKDNPYVGKSWEYSDDYGKIEWTVTNMGVRVDLGFKVFDDCIVIREDNQAVGFQSLTYYAPEYGIVRVVDPGGATEYYRMTSLEQVGEEEALQAVIKWAPNYKNIKDDRTQVY